MLQTKSDIFLEILERKQDVKVFSKAIPVSILNQVVGSGTNFFLGMYLVRLLTKEEFGLYGIGFAISLFYAGLGNALFLIQMVVNTPEKPIGSRFAYAASIGWAVTIFCVGTYIIVLLALPVIGVLWPTFKQYAGYGFAVAAASVSFLLKDFFIRHAYSARKEIWALAINLVVAATLGIILLVQHHRTVAITAISALWIYAVSHLMASVMGQILARLPLMAVQGKQVLKDYKEAWSGGRWSLVTNLTYTLRTQAHIIVTAWGVGPVGVAYLNAARLLVTPATMLTPALSQIFLPHLAELRISNRARVVHAGMLFAGILLLVSLVYSGMLLLSLDHVVPLALGPQYQSVNGIVVGWCLVMCLLAVRNGGQQILQALKGFRTLMIVNMISAIVAIIAVATLIQWMGLYGAVYGVALAEFVLAGALWKIIQRDQKGQS